MASIIGIKKCSFGFNDRYVYIIPSYTDDFKRIDRIIVQKTKKLNKNYNKTISDNRLFVFSPILVNREIVEEELVQMKNIQNEYDRRFNIIYVCTLYNIYIFNIKENKVGIVEMDKEEFNKISIKSSKEINKE